MKSKILFGLLFLATCVCSFARLGETKDEIYQRYGAVILRSENSSNEWTGFYEFKDYTISVAYSNNVSFSETILPRSLNSPVWRSFDKADINSLLLKVGGDGEWKEVDLDSSKKSRFWTNGSVDATAIEVFSPHESLVISRRGYIVPEKPKTKGF